MKDQRLCIMHYRTVFLAAPWSHKLADSTLCYQALESFIAGINFEPGCMVGQHRAFAASNQATD
jgi:hypothetical protein